MQANNSTEEMVPVILRDDFYRDGFRSLIISLLMTVGAIGLLIIVSLYFFLHQVLPVNLPVLPEWKVQADVPLDMPYVSTADMLQWVSKVLPSIFDADFVNYAENVKDNPVYFTPEGLSKYTEAVNTYLNQEEIVKKKQFVTATAEGAPAVLNKGIVEGKYAWWVQMPLSILYSDVDRNNHTVNLVFQVLVVRIPTVNNLDGIAIANMIVSKPK